MNFHYGQSFYLLIPFAGLVLLLLWSRWKRRRDLNRLGEWSLIRDLLPIDSLLTRNKKDIVALIGLFILIFATAGPQFGSKLKEVKTRGVDVFIAMDTSRSMLAEDVAPSRLSRAKRALSLLIQKLEGNRVGIIAYAKFAVIQSPLTIDIEAARLFLDILNVETVPIQGTSIGDAIRLALESFPKEDKGGKAIVLLTDGEDHESDPIEAAKEAKKAGVVIFTIGIGTTKGEVIKKRDDRGKVTEFHKHKGEMVLSRLDDALLTKIATITGGQYFRASSTDKEIDEIADYLNGFEKKEFSSKLYQRLKEQYQPFLLLAFLLLLLEFLWAERSGQWKRLKQKITITLFFLMFMPSLGYSDLKTHIIKGNQLVKKGDLEAARGEFESAQIDAPDTAFVPYNIGNTYLLEGDFEEAKVHYEQAQQLAKNPDLKSKIAYNLGFVNFFMKNKTGAVDQFKECLKYNHKDLDAKYNIEYILAGKEPKNPPQQREQSKGDSKGDKNEGDNDEQKGSGQGEGDPNQKKEGELSKEDAERVLQLMEGQESENMRNQNPTRAFKPKKDDEKENKPSEDW